MMAQVLRSLQLTWETWIEFLVPISNFNLVLDTASIWRVNQWMESLSLSLLLK